VAQGQTISGADPAGIVEHMQQMGYRAVYDVSSDGRPVIRSSIEGVNYEIWFYNCQESPGCKDLNFGAGFNLIEGMDLAKINEWNRTMLFGKAFVNEEGDPFIRHIVTTEGGISPESFERNVAMWGRALASFKDHIGWTN
jgi:hypothetical protein